MFEKIVKDYFSFTRKERIAVLVLVLLIVIIFLLPNWVPHDEKLDKASLDKVHLQLNQRQSIKEANSLNNHYPGVLPEERSDLVNPPSRDNLPGKSQMFYFDPNKISGEDWKKLGLRDKTIATIHNYLSKGGKFKNKEDISRIYGLRQDEIMMLMPYVRIANTQKELRKIVYDSEQSRAEPSIKSSAFKKYPTAFGVIDINTIDTTALIALPGIGSKLAARIVLFRQKLGGFYSTAQFSEAYGLPDSTFQKLKSHLAILKTAVPYLDINTATEDELKQHPYIRWQIASAIVAYRRQHGNFKSLQDLRKLELITEEAYTKMLPYLKIE